MSPVVPPLKQPPPMPVPSGPVSLRLTLNLPETVIQEYEGMARSSGITLETFLAQRLSDTLKWNARRPIYLNDENRKQLEGILKHNVSNADALIDAVGRLSLVAVGTTIIPLSEQLSARLRSRCPRNEDIHDYIRREALHLLEQSVGLR